MNGISKARPGRSRVKLSKSLQEELLDAIAMPSPVETSLPRDAPARSTKRHLDEIDQSPAKRVRLTKTQAPVLQHPKPIRRYASFLEKFVDPFQSGSCAGSEHSLVLEWLETVGHDRDTRCRSDSHLQHADDGPIPRELTISAPEMGHIRDANGFAVPTTPASIASHSQTEWDCISNITSIITWSSRRSARSLVENPLYRDTNLAANNISLLSSREQFPNHIDHLIAHVRRDRDSPGPTLDQVWEDKALEELGMGADEPKVEDYFRDRIFPKPGPADSLRRVDRQSMAKDAVPNTGSCQIVSTPVPDMLYGYNWWEAFPQQQAQLLSMGTEMAAYKLGLMYPFFLVEFVGDGGSLWVATNQCLGGSSACVNTAENLNRRLGLCTSDSVRPVDSAAFSIAMNGSEARLFLSWKQNGFEFYMANVDSFLLQNPEQYLKFRKYVRNILDWGRNERLEGIRRGLDSLLEERRRIARSRMPPSADSSSSTISRSSSSSSTSNQTGKTSSTRQKSEEHNSTQGQSSEGTW